MSATTLTSTRIVEGVWEGVLTRVGQDEGAPALVVSHLGEEVGGLEVIPAGPGEWALRLPIPARLISDGVQTFVIREADGAGEVLESFAIVAGAPLAEDLRAEIDLLREELDLLKQAFRRHCVETA
ncbi:hypothetical protein [Wenxinia marina]|uniref:Uncharacterized protein n=1 Tax=Wenxinia marina DSM 24838 TaxID=1123501 RepID=A0A0D0NPW9_9RHOB|nr:hypothetical protein [Wenxinia marina]KIQ70305.1 hypothetical protein Wenmar_00680 [Wenxinia marina DSM 24838]GGL54153.1 hypothetical protein GCM10011392_05710 [Wenxinia marina]